MLQPTLVIKPVPLRVVGSRKDLIYISAGLHQQGGNEMGGLRRWGLWAESHKGDYAKGVQKNWLFLFGCKPISSTAREQDLANNYWHGVIWEVGISLTSGSL